MDGFHYPPVDERIMRFGCYLTSVGRLHYVPGQSYPVTGHPARYDFQWKKGRAVGDHALILITGGNGQYETKEDGMRSLHAGDVLYLVPGQWHRYRPDHKTGWTERWVCLNGAVLHSLRAENVLPPRCAHAPDRVKPRMEQRLDRLLQDVSAFPRLNQPSWGARGLAVLLECFGDCEAPVETSPDMPDLVISEALRFIRENSHRPIQVRDVAEHCHLGRRTLERRFAASFLYPVARSIILSRIERAEMLLAGTTLPVKEIAYACGFGSPQRMIYDFRRHRGVTPGASRGIGD